MLATIRANCFILKTCVSERLTYRADFAFATLVRFLPIVTQIFLWGAVYAGDASRDLNGYTYRNMVAYALLVMVGRAFSSMPGLASGMARDIRDGTIKKYLTQPVDMLTYLFWSRVAHKCVYYIIATGPFVLVFYACRDFFDQAPGPTTIAIFIYALALAFLIGFLTESLIGMISFWFLEISSLVFIFMMMNYFLSGHMVPLDWLLGIFRGNDRLYEAARNGMALMPFQYMAYFPAAIMLGKIRGDNLTFHLIVGSVWVLLLLAANRVALARGLRRYSAFGG